MYTTNFRLDAWSPFVERGVTALLSGAKTILSEKCNGNTAVICQTFRNNPTDVRIT